MGEKERKRESGRRERGFGVAEIWKGRVGELARERRRWREGGIGGERRGERREWDFVHFGAQDCVWRFAYIWDTSLSRSTRDGKCPKKIYYKSLQNGNVGMRDEKEKNGVKMKKTKTTNEKMEK